MASGAEVVAMRRALDLARTPGVPYGPNPRVGCVLLDPDGSIVAEGCHRGAGHPHAEVDAIRAATGSTRGTTAVVTLEPCQHTGRTGPCVTALLDAGVRRVVFGQPDLSPVARGGADALMLAGVDVEGGVLAAEARGLNPEWTFAVEHGRPFVTWKFAATLDGRSAAADGTSRWISSIQARADAHRLRRTCDAVLVGTGTVLADDPRLTARDSDDVPIARHLQPLRAVMGLRDIPADAAVSDQAANTVHLATHDPHEALTHLYRRDRQHVLVEGGPTVAAAFLREGLVDRIVAYLAPTLLGAGPAAVVDFGVSTMTDALGLQVDEILSVGRDLRITARPGRE